MSCQVIDFDRIRLVRDAREVGRLLVTAIVLPPIEDPALETGSRKRSRPEEYKTEIEAFVQTLVSVYDHINCVSIAPQHAKWTPLYGALVGYLFLLQEFNTSYPLFTDQERAAVDRCWRVCVHANESWDQRLESAR